MYIGRMSRYNKVVLIFAMEADRLSGGMTPLALYGCGWSDCPDHTVMSDEHSVSLQIRMQSHPTLMPIIVLQRIEEPLPPLREVMMSAVCLCADKRIVSIYSEVLYDPLNKMFSRNFMLTFIFCVLRF